MTFQKLKQFGMAFQHHQHQESKTTSYTLRISNRNVDIVLAQSGAQILLLWNFHKHLDGGDQSTEGDKPEHLQLV